MKKLLLILFCMLLGSCATTAKYKANLDTWTGMHIDDLVMSWGPPQGNFKFSNGNTMIEYIQTENIQIRGHQTSTPHTRTRIINGTNRPYTTYTTTTTPAYNIQNTCKTRFIVDSSGKIISSTFIGDCYAE